MKINERGFWENETTEGHGYDEGLAEALVSFFKKENVLTVLDVGCGTGYYTKYLWYNSIHCTGYDGNPNTESLTGGFCKTLDFTKEQNLTQFDWILSLEVGEHIPQHLENIFLGNLDRHNKHGMILSWAVRGQGGDGHVNCKDNYEVIDEITKLGYTFDKEATQKLRNSAAEYPTPCYWFRNTLMVFRRIK